MIERIQTIENKQIVEMWNTIADIRYSQIKNGEDDSFSNVLLPNMLSFLDKTYASILDLGCGNGLFTRELISYSPKITGIDFSEQNIKLAKQLNTNISFILSNAENYQSSQKFSCVISNMFLMDARNLKSIISNTTNLLEKNGDFIFSITHPCYWPIYWNYYKENWFDYNKEIIIQNNFRIGQQILEQKTIHFHRPLEMYIQLINENKLELIKMKELKGKYFSLPRFLLIKCKKRG